MARDITIGQYLPGKSIMHRLDPRVKITLTFCFIIMAFISRSPASLAFLIAVLILMIACSHISAAQIFSGIRSLIPVILITAIVNIFYVSGDPVIHFYFIHISKQGLFVGLGFLIRLTAMIAGSSLITYTTSLSALTSGLEQMISPLEKIHVRVGELAMMITITLRFIPTLAEEISRITDAQKARGAEIGSGGPIKRIKSYSPVVLPLFMSSFRRAFELTNAIECRCYHGDKGRTRMNTLTLTRADAVALTLCVAAFCATIALNFIPIIPE
ncbi:energy-coupling factor transporter transmembrane component T family protein [Sporolactobacillus pectinivorans]|uniref:energy-coupling factor transporter transmembrane component T family protein n=1 Tax=Sporolactobacillus pectinivorans TaxID=1591408 RepID=UPI000C25D1D2|nr:energy-coupling factor transporter transmembrane component T [Sporolactobacillus pectinivorans]